MIHTYPTATCIYVSCEDISKISIDIWNILQSQDQRCVSKKRKTAETGIFFLKKWTTAGASFYMYMFWKCVRRGYWGEMYFNFSKRHGKLVWIISVNWHEIKAFTNCATLTHKALQENDKSVNQKEIVWQENILRLNTEKWGSNIGLVGCHVGCGIKLNLVTGYRKWWDNR